jgi:hypothetical protein
MHHVVSSCIPEKIFKKLSRLWQIIIIHAEKDAYLSVCIEYMFNVSFSV